MAEEITQEHFSKERKMKEMRKRALRRFEAGQRVRQFTPPRLGTFDSWHEPPYVWVLFDGKTDPELAMTSNLIIVDPADSARVKVKPVK
jgi:hypothetical protein